MVTLGHQTWGKYDQTVWRDTEYYTEEIEHIYKFYNKVLRDIYDKYS